MEITALCAVIATLRVVPDRAQFFKYESVSLSCEQDGNSSEWRVKRNTSMHINEDCHRSWDRRSESYCFIDIHPLDSGVYWCESGAGECSSNTINISVTAGLVILESPVLPVMEGDDVTLRCIHSLNPSANLTTYFYKDKLLIGSSCTGNLTIHSVSESDEGLYRCSVSGAGDSPDSWLRVTEALRPEPSQSLHMHILLPVVGAYLLLVSALLLCLWRSHKDEIDPEVVTYTVTVTQKYKGGRPRTRSSVFSSVAVYRRVKHTEACSSSGKRIVRNSSARCLYNVS